ncbi:MAG: nucleoside-diphosphate kinase [Patescibacteria group bacterium]|nr:MAG: nucleoside-diphosphate kinase [Patescibacteria group bacterium]
MFERTVVVFKPDSVGRGLVGEVLSRFERAGLRIVGSKTVTVTEGFVAKHYPDKVDFLRSMGMKTLENYAEYGLDPLKELGTDDPVKIGRRIRRWNMEFLSRGSVIAFVLEGNHAVKNVRRLVGKTIPTTAESGTIRGDYSVDSSILANREKRAVHNLVHASGTVEEAQEEIKLWFKPSELV